LAAVAVATMFAGTPSTAVAAAPGCEQGTAKGVWELPDSGMDNGYIDGFLFLSTSPSTLPRYHFTAALTDVPTPCLSCITGKINGYLDDGFGPAPDFVVRGSYSGLFLSGKGTFQAQVYTPAGTAPVGKINGSFADAPGSTVKGSFKGDWQICN
jgi:hypothetical protein